MGLEFLRPQLPTAGSYLEHKANGWVRSKLNVLVGPQERLLATVKRRKLASFGHVTCYDRRFKAIRQGTLEGGRGHGRQGKCWMDIPAHGRAHKGLP